MCFNEIVDAADLDVLDHPTLTTHYLVSSIINLLHCYRCAYIYIYIYIYRERERKRFMDVKI